MLKQISLICKLIYGSQSDGVEQGLEYRLSNSNYILDNKKDIIIDRIKLVIKTILLPIEFIYNKDISCEKNCNLIFGVGTKEEIYERCINHYFKGTISSVYDRHYYKEGKMDLLFWGWYFKFLKVSIISLFDATNHPYGFLISVYRNIMSIVSVRRMIRGIYGFFVYNPISYLTMAALTGNKIGHVYAMFEVFLEMNKYFILPVEKGYFLSKIMLEEINYYKMLPFFNLQNYEYLGSINMFEKGDAQDHKFEIGFFSTGAWARKNGEDRALEDFNNIEVGNNTTARYEHAIFCSLAQYAKTNGVKVKYYLHPYEKEIYQKYGALPPEYKMVDNRNVFFEDSDNQSSLNDRFNEVYIAVAVRSSSIMERFNIGYSNNFMYDYKNELPCTLARYNKEALGEYTDMFYNNGNELIEKIDKLVAEINIA